MDTTFVRVRGQSQGILVAVALGGKPLLVQAVGAPQDYQHAFTLLRRLGADVVVSDDEQAFVDPLERLGVDRQACVWHAARALGRTLRKLTAGEREQWQDLITLLWESLKALPPHPPDALFQAQRLSLPPTLNGARWSISSNSGTDSPLYQRRPGLPQTNNLSERAIQRSKHRARTVRGFKSQDGAVNFFAATQYLLATA